MSAAPNLQYIQSAFQDYVLCGDKAQPAMAALIVDQFGLPVAERLAIYHDAYRIRLAEALAEAFDKTHAYVGDDTFAELCQAYIDQHPSSYRNLRWFGDQFPAFVAQAMADYPVVGELAGFEWALSLAFDAADAPVLTAEALQQLGSEDWEQIGFVPHPSLQLLPMHWNVPAIWLALEKQKTPPDAISVERACTWLVWRKDLQPHFRSLTAYEAQALHGLANGLSFSGVCGAAAEAADEDITPQIAGWLHTWMMESVLSSINRLCIEG